MFQAVLAKQKGKIYCANCMHCKLFRVSTEEGKYVLRVRCAAGRWRKKLGGEKQYKYFTVARRALDECDSYFEMGESKAFMKDLRRSLPVKDEIFDVSDQSA